jgi:predicted porin
MKKYALLMALALAAGFAQAQTTPQVGIYGKIRQYQESYTLGTASALTRLTNDSSRLGFKATTNVGSGVTASAVIETGILMDAPGATTLGDRTALFSLDSKFGSIGLGRDKHSVTRALDNFDVMENAYGTSATTIHSAQGSRLQNAVFVSTPTVAGFKGNYAVSNSEAAGVSNAHAASIDYAAGPVSATVASYSNRVNSSSTILGAKYTVAKTGTTVFGMYSDDKVSGVGSTGKSVGVRQAISPQVALLGSYGETNTGVSAKALGVAYSMSKSLTLHGRWASIDNVKSVADVKQYGVGIEYNF